jgi:hypothetical protein
MSEPPIEADPHAPAPPRRRAETAWGLRTAGYVGLVLLAVGLLALLADPSRWKWTFTERDTPVHALGLAMPLPEGGAWTIEEHAGATGGRALVNHVGDVPSGHAIAVTSSTPSGDLTIHTRCEPGEHDEAACGVVFGYRGPADFFLYRVDARADKVELVRVEGAKTTALTGLDEPIDPKTWQSLTVEIRGSRVRASRNGGEILEMENTAIASPGRVGLWAPSGGLAVFDELTLLPVSKDPDPLELLPILSRGRG